MVPSFRLPLLLRQLLRARKREKAEKLDPPSESAVQDRTECILITRIRAINFAIRLRRIPVGFYVTVGYENVARRTCVSPASVRMDVVEWNEEIILPTDQSSRITVTVYASFELEPTLGNGEVLYEFEVTVDELLDRKSSYQPIRFSEQDDGDVTPFIEVEIEQRVFNENECVTPSNQTESDKSFVGELTAKGHVALVRYREFQERRDLDESIAHFEHAESLCPPGHTNRASVLFNLATAKLIRCRLQDVSPDLDVPIDLYRAALGLRPLDHPDYPFTLLSLAIALLARFQQKRDEADEVESRTFLYQLLDVSSVDCYAYHAALYALGNAGDLEWVEQKYICEGSVDDVGDGEEVERLDAALQRILYKGVPSHALLDHLGILFCIQLDHDSSLDAPETATPMREVVVPSLPDDHPRKPWWLDDLGRFFVARYQCFGNLVDLEKSVSMRVEAVRLATIDDPNMPAYLDDLGHSLYTRYSRFGNVGDLERSISLRQEALELTPDDHPQWVTRLGSLGSVLRKRYERFAELADLERSIAMLQEALQLAPDGHPDNAKHLASLGCALWTRHLRFGDAADLEKSLSVLEEALQLTPDGHPDKATRLGDLTSSLRTRYNRSGDVDDLERWISIANEVLRVTPNGHLDRASRLGNLAFSLLSRHYRFDGIDDLEQSILLREEALQLTPYGHPDEASRLVDLSYSLSARYDRFGDVAAMHRSILLTEEALELTQDDHPHKALRLADHAYMLSSRFQRYRDDADLENSISLAQKSLLLTPDDHPEAALLLEDLGYSFAVRYHRFGDVGDLEKSISMREVALQVTPDGHRRRPVRVANLGYTLRTRYDRFGELADLQKSISILEEALQLTPDGHPDRTLRFADLAYSLWARYERCGDVADLERSISMLQEAVQLTPDDHPDKALRLGDLGYSLQTRFDRFGDLADLEKAISMAEEELRLTPDGHPDRFIRLGGYAHSLLTRYLRFGNVFDLERAIMMREEALQLVPDDHPGKAAQFSSLGHMLLTRYERSSDVADLEKSTSMMEEALQLTPDNHPYKASRLMSIGHSFRVRYDRFAHRADLEKSISLTEAALQLSPDGDPDRPLQLQNLGSSLLKRFERFGDLSHSDLPRAMLYASQAAHCSTGPTSRRFRASQLWILCARTHHDSQSLLDAYTVAVDLLPQLAWMGLSLDDRYSQLLQAAGTVCDAAAAALEAGLPERAVEWLEQGRSVVWSQLSQLRTPIGTLRATYPELAAQFEHVSHKLERAGSIDKFAVNVPTEPSDMTVENPARQHYLLALERDKLLTEIRALPGFERFLLPKTIDQLSSLTHSGPVVFLTASRYRCDALAVVASSERVIHIPLSNMSYEDVSSMQLKLNTLLNFSLQEWAIWGDDADRGGTLFGTSPEDVFGHILPTLWDKVVNPILDALGLLTAGRLLSRIFWCPTGPFAFLPIHAAGHYDTSDSGRQVSEFVISSYIPTMAALQETLEPSSSSRTIRLLAVRQPSTDGLHQLGSVPNEMENIKRLTSLSPFVNLQEADGTVEDVLAKMTTSDWVHFACHGIQDRIYPIDSGLLLAHCRRLMLSDIIRLSRPRGGLAFLSACQTAMGDEFLSEEAVHLAAGMLLAGYRGVIATMWSIRDGDAPRVTEEVYKSLFGGGKAPDSGRAAEALHDAIKRLRESGAPFLSWVPFIHVGL